MGDLEVRAVRLNDTGGPDMLRVESVSVPAPGPLEVRVRHRAIGVNYIDTYHRSGLYSLPLPAVLGTEAAGEVEAVGESVEDFCVGDRVAHATAGAGAYAEARNVLADRLVALPDDMEFDLAAACLLKGMTAEFLIRRVFPVQRGQVVLLHAAAGGVGSLATQWLAGLGATVLGTVGSEAKADYARERGCTHPIVYTQEDFVARTHELTEGALCHVVYDSVGKDTFLRSLQCVRRRGMLVGFGNASGRPPAVDPALLAQGGSLFLTRASLFDYCATPEELRASARALFEVVREGTLRIDIGQRFPLAQVAEAHRALESRSTMGATVLSVA